MNNAQELRELILKLLKQKDKNTSQMLTELGFSNSLLLDMKRKGSMPSADKLAKIAEYFNVSVDYLLGRTDNPEIQKETNNKIDIEQAVLNYIENFNNNSELKAINIFKDGEEQKIVKMTNEQYEEFRKRYGNFDD